MCPACVASATMVVGSVVSGGGVAAVVARIWKKSAAREQGPGTGGQGPDSRTVMPDASRNGR